MLTFYFSLDYSAFSFRLILVSLFNGLTTVDYLGNNQGFGWQTNNWKICAKSLKVRLIKYNLKKKKTIQKTLLLSNSLVFQDWNFCVCISSISEIPKFLCFGWHPQPPKPCLHKVGGFSVLNTSLSLFLIWPHFQNVSFWREVELGVSSSFL